MVDLGEDAGGVQSRQDGSDDDSELGELDAQGLAQYCDRGLRGRVDGVVRVPLIAGDRGDVDDDPGTLGSEVRQERLGQRQQSEDVGLVLAVDLVHAGALERAHLVVAGVVYEHVHTTELLLSELGERPRGRLIVDVEQQGLHAREVGMRFEVGLFADGGDDVPAFCRELVDRGPSNAGGRTGHDDRLGHVRLPVLARLRI